MGGAVNAQVVNPLRLSSITINEGLSQGFVSFITQDSRGLMWFATGDGLNKYDGYNFVVYHHDTDDPHSIGSDDLTYVFEDSRQRLWIGTRNSGLDFFDRQTHRFYHIRQEDGLISNHVSFISEDREGALWITTEAGIVRMEILPAKVKKSSEDFFDKHWLRFTPLEADSHVEEKTFNNIVKGSIFTDSRGSDFFVTNHNIYALKKDGEGAYSFEKKGSFPVLNSNFISGILEDVHSRSLLINSDRIIRYPDHDFTTPQTLHRFSPELPGHIWAPAQKGGIWVSENARLYYINPASGEQRVYMSSDSLQNEALHTTTCLFSDKQGVLWIGTGGYGLLKYDPEVERFHHILPGTRQYRLVEIRPGVVMTNNFEKIGIRKGRPAVDLSDPFLLRLRKNFRNHNILRFTCDSEGNIWVPDGRKLYRYNFELEEEKVFSILPVESRGGTSFVYADKAGNIWFDLRQQWVKFIPPSGLQPVNLPISPDDVDSDFVQDIFEDGKLLWLATKRGLVRFNRQTMVIEATYRFQLQVPGSLSNDFVFSVCNDIAQPDRFLWVGTKGGGLNRLDKATGEFTRYSTRQGLANNVVYGILPGNDGNLWLSTNKGLSAFNPETGLFRNYDEADGLQSNEFNRYAYCKTNEGLLVFGGMNGINYFDPTELKPLAPPPIVFTDFRLFNRKVDVRDPAGPLKADINYTSEIRLRYEQNMITFQFAGADYRRQGSIRYRYKMEGFDKDWVYAGTLREATYTNLAPGTYTFRVQGSFDNNTWGRKSKSVEVHILTPWYLSWWFYSLVSLSVLLAFYGLYRFRVQQLRRMEKLRNRIARDLHDEIGSTISTISIYSKIMQEQEGKTGFDNRPLLDKITTFSGEIMDSMKDIVWDINTRNDTFDRMISRMREYSTQLLEPKGYRVHFQVDESLNTLVLGMEKRRDFFLVFKEALNNVLKYAGGEQVWICLTLRSDELTLTVRDDGRGFSRQKVSTGNGLYNMQQRAGHLKGLLQVDSEEGQGTTVTLTFKPKLHI